MLGGAVSAGEVTGAAGWASSVPLALDDCAAGVLWLRLLVHHHLCLDMVVVATCWHLNALCMPLIDTRALPGEELLLLN